MHYSPSPGTLQIRAKATPIQQCGYLALATPLFDKCSINVLDYLLFGGRPRCQDDTVRLKTLMLPTCQNGLGLSTLIKQLTSQSIPRRTTLPITQLNQARLASKHFDGKLPAVLTSHHAFHAFDDAGNRGAIIDELLGTILNPHTALSAMHFVTGTYIGILKASPPADVIHQNCREA
ncbi:hypothetical protein D3C77_441580 [compost metagenome]